MTNKPRKSLKQSNPALMRAIYWAIIIGIAAIFAIVTLEAMLGIFRDSL